MSKEDVLAKLDASNIFLNYEWIYWLKNKERCFDNIGMLRIFFFLHQCILRK